MKVSIFTHDGTRVCVMLGVERGGVGRVGLGEDIGRGSSGDEESGKSGTRHRLKNVYGGKTEKLDWLGDEQRGALQAGWQRRGWEEGKLLMSVDDEGLALQIRAGAATSARPDKRGGTWAWHRTPAAH